MFFSFDGVDGVGKSTQIELFCKWLEEEGYPLLRCRDPGGTELGEEVRSILLGKRESQVDIRAEMFLYMASRAQLVAEVIRPALKRGKVVVSDRYLLANVVYQGVAGGLGAELVWNVGEMAVEDVNPDMTFVLDMDPAVAATRLNRELDRMEAKGLDFLRAVRTGFLTESQRLADRVSMVDADRKVESIQAEIREVARTLLVPRSSP